MNNKPLPSQASLKLLFDYNPETGDLTRRIIPIEQRHLSEAIGYLSKNYLETSINGVRYKLHRLIWRWMTGEDPGDLMIDHKDRNKLNNCWSNLRKADFPQQNCNRTLPNKTGFRGVKELESGRFFARGTLNNKRVSLGTYQTAEEAARVVDAHNLQIYGEFAVLNFPESTT
jgi:hypothetical protein